MSDNQVSYTDDGKVKLYVGSLPFDTRSPDLEEMFVKYGNVSSAHVVMEKDNETRSRGFGFVQFDTLEEAEDAIKGLNETPLGHRHIMVQHAGKPASGRPPQRRGGGGDRGGFRGRGGRGGFGDRGGRGGRGGGRGRGRGGYDRGGRGGGSYGGYNQRGGYGGDNGGGYGGQGGYDQSSGYGGQGGYNQSSGYGGQGGYNQGGQGGNSGQGRSDWY